MIWWPTLLSSYWSCWFGCWPFQLFYGNSPIPRKPGWVRVFPLFLFLIGQCGLWPLELGGCGGGVTATFDPWSLREVSSFQCFLGPPHVLSRWSCMKQAEPTPPRTCLLVKDSQRRRGCHIRGTEINNARRKSRTPVVHRGQGRPWNASRGQTWTHWLLHSTLSGFLPHTVVEKAPFCTQYSQNLCPT